MTKSDAPKKMKKPANNNKPNAMGAYTSPLKAITSELSALRNDTPFNSLELKSVRSMIAYVAHQNHVDEDIVRTNLEFHYSVDDYSKISAHQYDNVIQYLVDMNVHQAIN